MKDGTTRTSSSMSSSHDVCRQATPRCQVYSSQGPRARTILSVYARHPNGAPSKGLQASLKTGWRHRDRTAMVVRGCSRTPDLEPAAPDGPSNECALRTRRDDGICASPESVRRPGTSPRGGNSVKLRAERSSTSRRSYCPRDSTPSIGEKDAICTTQL